MSDDKKSDDDPYWDDDKPIKELMELREKIWKRQREQKLAKQKDEAEKAAKSRRTSSSGAPRSTTERRKDELYYATRKGDLVQKFLTRWWHAYDWPTAQDINGTAPSGYEAMDGFKGVYVCMNTQASVEHPLGKILDLRSKDGNCPSLSNISTKSASEIQALCITAYERQIAALISEMGEDEHSSRVMALRKELKEVKMCDVASADAEAARYVF